MAVPSNLGILSSAFTATTGLKLKEPDPVPGKGESVWCPQCGTSHYPLIHPIYSLFHRITGGRFAPTPQTRTPEARYAETRAATAQTTTAQTKPDVIMLSAKDLFGLTYMMIQPPSGTVLEGGVAALSVHVIMLKTNVQVTVQVRSSATVKELREDAAKKVGLRPVQLMLIFDNSQLEDHEEIKDLDIASGCTIIGMKCTPGQKMGIFELDPASLAPKYDYDFTSEADDGATYHRGDFTYNRPYGWKRYAVKVLGEYESDKWLGVGGIRKESTDGEWPVSFHGTGKCNVQGIVEEGYKIGYRQRFGPGIYTSPSLDKVDEYNYVKTFTHEGKSYRLALQNRVNPDRDHLKVISPEETGFPGFPYWVSPLQDPPKGIYDVRPYGILTREV